LSLLTDGTVERPLDLSGQVNRREILFWKEVIFTRFVNYTEKAFGLRVGVANDLVNLPQLKLRLIPFMARQTTACGLSLLFIRLAS
jgi:hypothetical protein